MARLNAREAIQTARTARTVVNPTPNGTAGSPQLPLKMARAASAAWVSGLSELTNRSHSGASGGSGRVEVDGQVLGRKGGETTVESAGWTGRGDRYRVAIVGGSKSIEIIGR